MKKIPWYKQKTTWTAILSSLSAIAGALMGEITWSAAAGIISPAILSIFLRQGIEKVRNDKPATGDSN